MKFHPDERFCVDGLLGQREREAACLLDAGESSGRNALDHLRIPSARLRLAARSSSSCSGSSELLGTGAD